MCTILEYQFPLRYQLSLGFLKSFRNTAEVELFNFEEPTQQINLDCSYIKTRLLNLAEEVAGNDNMCEQFQGISSLTDILELG